MKKKNKQLKKIIKVPAEELDMFYKYGVKEIIKGNTTIKLTKPKTKSNGK